MYGEQAVSFKKSRSCGIALNGIGARTAIRKTLATYSLRTIYNSLNPSLVDDNSEQLDSEQAGHKLSSVDTNTLLTRQMQTRYVLHAYIVVSDSK